MQYEDEPNPKMNCEITISPIFYSTTPKRRNKEYKCIKKIEKIRANFLPLRSATQLIIKIPNMDPNPEIDCISVLLLIFSSVQYN